MTRRAYISQTWSSKSNTLASWKLVLKFEKIAKYTNFGRKIENLLELNKRLRSGAIFEHEGYLIV